MELTSVLKYEATNDDELVWKHPATDILVGSQLIVGEGQQAIFLKGGQAVDTFRAGTHTLITGNLPILEKINKFSNLQEKLLFLQNYGF